MPKVLIHILSQFCLPDFDTEFSVRGDVVAYLYRQKYKGILDVDISSSGMCSYKIPFEKYDIVYVMMDSLSLFDYDEMAIYISKIRSKCKRIVVGNFANLSVMGIALKIRADGYVFGNFLEANVAENKQIYYSDKPYQDVEIEDLQISDESSFISGEKGRYYRALLHKGCSNQCAYCNRNTAYSFSRDFNNIFKEFSRLTDTIVEFVDDNFADNPKRMTEFLKALIEQHFPLAFRCQISFDKLAQIDLNLLKEANFDMVYIGVDRADNAYHGEKFNVDYEDKIKICKKLKEMKLNYVFGAVINVEHETFGRILQLATLIKNLDPSRVVSFSNYIRILAGSDLYKHNSVKLKENENKINYACYLLKDYIKEDKEFPDTIGEVVNIIKEG